MPRQKNSPREALTGNRKEIDEEPTTGECKDRVLGSRRKINNLDPLNVHFKLQHFLLHCVSRQLGKYKCVLFIYKALLGLQKKIRVKRYEEGEKQLYKVAIFLT